MPIIVNLNVQRALDINGFAVPGALATFYNSGTTALRTVYSDPECTIPHPNPLAANGAGVFPPIYDAEASDIRVLLTDANGTTLSGYPVDPVMRVSTEETGAASVAFAPTVEIPETNVQAAIERLQENIVEPLADFGLGVTGNAALLADLNAADIASGFYRFDGTTVGTYPSGVTAASLGIVLLFRRTSSNALMLMQAGTENRIHYRRYSGGSWQAWRRLIDDSDTLSLASWQSGASTAETIVSPAKVKAASEATGLGWGQAWVYVTGSRVVETQYQNTTGKPIVVSVTADALGPFRYLQVRAPGGDWINVDNFIESGTLFSCAQGIVPPSHFYRVTGSMNVSAWAELR